jgi:hypothetical protein
VDCAECARLTARRGLLEARYAKTLTLLAPSVVGGVVGDFLENRKAADEARADLDLMEAEIMRHQGSHT